MNDIYDTVITIYNVVLTILCIALELYRHNSHDE